MRWKGRGVWKTQGVPDVLRIELIGMMVGREWWDPLDVWPWYIYMQLHSFKIKSQPILAMIYLSLYAETNDWHFQRLFSRGNPFFLFYNL